MPHLRRYGRAVSPLTAATCQRKRSGSPRRRARSDAPYRDMVADRKVWPDARTGAKGQRPTHGRAGAGLACPAGIGAGANAIVQARSSDNSPAIYGWVRIQSTNQVPAGTKESPGLAKDSAVPGRDFGRFRNVNPAINGWAIFKRISFPRVRDMVAVCKDWPDARSGAKGQRPMQGRAGAGLASPAGIEAGVVQVVMA
jgi:hypothetical protein